MKIYADSGFGWKIFRMYYIPHIQGNMERQVWNVLMQVGGRVEPPCRKSTASGFYIKSASCEKKYFFLLGKKLPAGN